MSQRVTVKKTLRRLTNGTESVEVQGNTVNEIFNQLEEKFPGIRRKLCARDGELRRFIDVYVDGKNIRYLNSLDTSVDDKAEVSIDTGVVKR